MTAADPSNDEWIFSHPEAIEAANEALNGLLDAQDFGKLDYPKYIAKLQRLLKKYPLFIDGHAHYGIALFDNGEYDAAAAAYERGTQIGDEAMPPRFRGRVDWAELDNRPYLRCLHGLALCRQKQGQLRDSVAIMKRMLRFNPRDNQGVRFLVGSGLLRLGQISSARRYLAKAAESYPGCRYDLALLDYIGGSDVAAATTLRWGFVENGYIAEMLCGMRRPPPLMIWAGTNLADRDTAEAYVEAGGDLWWTTPGAIEFLRWLHMHPRVLEERARFIECQQELVWLEPGEARSKVVRRLEVLEREMRPELSEAIVTARRGRDGNRYHPWAGSQVLG